MTPQQLEAAVLEAVDQLRAKGAVEDDRVELKREWPVAEKARQLAGTANRARGNYIIYIIGLDEKTGATHPIGDTDPATWWAQVSSQFDGVAPELLYHLNVPVDASGRVTAMLFDTRRAPYVVRTRGGSPEREVPIRDGTRTRSARRDELMRMLAPSINIPRAELLDASIAATWLAAIPSAPGRVGREEHASLTGGITLFVVHVARDAVMLPSHEMTGHLNAADDLRFPVRPWVDPPRDTGTRPINSYGVTVRHDGVVITGPGVFRARLELELPGISGGGYRERLSSIGKWDLSLKFGVAGADQSIELGGTLVANVTQQRERNEFFEELSEWRMPDFREVY